MYLCGVALKNIYSEFFLQIIIKAIVAGFTFSKISCFQCILLNTRLEYENCSFRLTF